MCPFTMNYSKAIYITTITSLCVASILGACVMVEMFLTVLSNHIFEYVPLFSLLEREHLLLHFFYFISAQYCLFFQEKMSVIVAVFTVR